MNNTFHDLMLLLHWILLSGRKVAEMEEAVCENHWHTALEGWGQLGGERRKWRWGEGETREGVPSEVCEQKRGKAELDSNLTWERYISSQFLQFFQVEKMEGRGDKNGSLGSQTEVDIGLFLDTSVINVHLNKTPPLIWEKIT